MIKFLFVLGSNWRLSLLEIDLILRNEPFKGRITDYSANIAIVEIEEGASERSYANVLEKILFTLGGTLKIAEVLDFIDIYDIKSAFPEVITSMKDLKSHRNKLNGVLDNCLDKIFPKIQNQKMFFANSIYPNLYNDDYYKKVLVKHFLPYLNLNMMRILKDKKAIKAIFYKYPEKNMINGSLNPIFPHHILKYKLLERDRAEIIFGFTEEGCYIGRTITVTNSNFQKSVDEDRPFTSFERSIPPKFAKVMLNFLNLYKDKESKKILDPFVGSGTILLFAYIQGFDIYGAEKDPKYINQTIKNLNWLSRFLEEEELPNFSSRIIKSEIGNLVNVFKEEFFDGICSEPVFGPFYKKRPDIKTAKDLLETEVIPIFEELFHVAGQLLKPGCRLCITAPVIETEEQREIQLPLKKMAEKNKFVQIPIFQKNRIYSKSNKILQLNLNSLKSIIDSKKGQIIKRKFFIFQK